MDILEFVEREAARQAEAGRDGLDLAEVRLAMSPEDVSAILRAWRADGALSALPLTYAEFARALGGCAEPSESVRQVWSRRLEAFGGPGFRKRLDAFPGPKEEYERSLSHDFASHAERIAARYAAEGATAASYAHYLRMLGPRVRKAFFRRWALPFPAAAGGAHSYLVAATGSGKSEYLKARVHEHVRRGEGVALIDPHGELAEQVARLREVAGARDREGRPLLVYVDPFLASPDGAVTPVINPLEGIQGGHRERVIGCVAYGIARTVEDDLTTRMRLILKAALWGLSSLDETPSLVRLSEALGDPVSDLDAKRLLAEFQDRIGDPVIRKYLGRDYLSGNLAPTREGIRNRLFSVTMSPVFRNMLTGKSTIDLRHEMDRGAILVFNLSQGKTDPDLSVLLGKFLVSSLFSAATERAARNERERKAARPMYAYIDEADRYVNEAAEDILKYTRKYGLFLGLAQQNPYAHMPASVSDAVRQNALLKVAGSANDPGVAGKVGDMVGADPDEVMRLRTGEFFFRWKDPKAGPAVRRAFVHRRLMRASAYVSWEEWEAVREEQIALYYRHHAKEYAEAMEARREALDTGARKVAAT